MYQPNGNVGIIRCHIDHAKQSLFAVDKQGTIMALIVMYKMKRSYGDTWIVQQSEGRHRYGAFIYETAMNHIYPDWITSDILLTSPEARKVWRIYNKREDVESRYSKTARQKDFKYLENDYRLSKPTIILPPLIKIGTEIKKLYRAKKKNIRILSVNDSLCNL